MASSSSQPANGRARNPRDGLSSISEGSSSSSGTSSRMQAVSKALLAPFTSKSDSTRILQDLAPIIMTPRMISTAATSRNARGNPSTIAGRASARSDHALDFAILGRAPLRFGVTRRVTSTDLQVVEETPQLLAADVPEPRGVANDVSLLRGFQATIPSSERGKNRRRQVRNVDVPHMGLKQLGMRARGMLDADQNSQPDEELGSKSDDDMVLVGRTRPAKRKLKPKARRGRESLSASVALGRDELLLQTKEIMVDKENIHIRRTLINSEIEEITHKIAALDAVREKLEQELLHLHEDELELDDEMEGVRERLSYEEARNPMAGKSSQAASASASSRRRRGPAFLPSEHDELPQGVAFMTLTGHSAPITALDFSEPYGLLVSAAQDDSTRLWDLCSGEEIGRLRGHSGPVKCTQVEEHVCLTGGADSTLRVWDLRLVDEEIPGAEDADASDEFGVRQANASIDDSMAEDSGCMRVLRGHSKAITALYFEDNCLVTGAADKTLRQWDLTTGQCVVSMDILWAMNHSPVQQASWLNLGTAPFSYATDDGELYEDFVGAVQFWGYGLVSGSGDGAVRMWDMRTGQSHRSLVGHTAPVTCVQFDELNIVSGSLDKTIRIWDIRTGGVLETLPFERPVTSLQFDTRKILACTGENGPSSYNRTTQQMTSLLTNGHTMPAVRLRYMDRYLVSGGRDSVVKVWAL